MARTNTLLVVSTLALGGCPADDGEGTGGEGGSSGPGASMTSGATTPSTATPTGAGTGTGTPSPAETEADPDSSGTGSDDGVADSTSTGPMGPPPECVATVDAANAFIAALDDDQRAALQFDWGAGERDQFEFLPPNSAARDGLTLRDVDPAQTDQFEAFLAAAMSGPGFDKVEDIRALESVLAMEESGRPVTDNRDPDNYFISVFGTPNVDGGEPWGWRFEGHHLSLHGSMVDCDRFSATPAFWGVSPVLDPIQTEVDLAVQLWEALDDDQRTQADADVEVDAVGAKEGLIPPFDTQGVPAGEMTAPQAALLRELVAEYANNMNAPVAADRIDAVEAAGFDDVRFTYDPGRANWRVLGPTFVIEFIYTNPTHVHSVWRDYVGDYGEDLIAQHLRAHSHRH